MLYQKTGKLVLMSLGGAALCLSLGRCSPIAPSLYRNSMKGAPSVRNTTHEPPAQPATDSLKAMVTGIELKSEEDFDARVAASAPSQVISINEEALAELKAGNAVKFRLDGQFPSEMIAILAVKGVTAETEAKHSSTRVVLVQETAGDWSLKLAGEDEPVNELRASLLDIALIWGQESASPVQASR